MGLSGIIAQFVGNGGFLEVPSKLKMAKFSKRTKTKSKVIRCYLPNTRYKNFQEMLPEFNEAAQKFDALNKQRKSKAQ